MFKFFTDFLKYPNMRSHHHQLYIFTQPINSIIFIGPENQSHKHPFIFLYLFFLSFLPHTCPSYQDLPPLILPTISGITNTSIKMYYRKQILTTTPPSLHTLKLVRSGRTPCIETVKFRVPFTSKHESLFFTVYVVMGAILYEFPYGFWSAR